MGELALSPIQDYILTQINQLKTKLTEALPELPISLEDLVNFSKRGKKLQNLCRDLRGDNAKARRRALNIPNHADAQITAAIAGREMRTLYSTSLRHPRHRYSDPEMLTLLAKTLCLNINAHAYLPQHLNHTCLPPPTPDELPNVEQQHSLHATRCHLQAPPHFRRPPRCHKSGSGDN